MDDFASKISEARSAGHSDDDIIGYLSSDPNLSGKISEAKANGYAAKDIIDGISQYHVPEEKSIIPFHVPDPFNVPGSRAKISQGFDKLTGKGKSLDERIGGAVDMVSGVGRMLGPVVAAPALLSAGPGAFATGVVGAGVGSFVGGQGAKALGAGPGVQSAAELGGGIVGGGAGGGLYNVVKGAIAPKISAEVALTRALKPSADEVVPDVKNNNTSKFQRTAWKAVPIIKQVEAQVGQPVNSALDAATYSNTAMQENRVQFAQYADQLRNYKVPLNGTPIRTAIVDAIPEKFRTPALMKQITTYANTYKNGMDVGTLLERLKTTNAELDNFYAENPAQKGIALRADPRMAGLHAEADALRDVLYQAMDRQGMGAAPRELQHQYGQLRSFDALLHDSWGQDVLDKTNANPGIVGKMVTAADKAGNKPISAIVRAGLHKLDKQPEGLDELLTHAFKSYDGPGAPQVPPAQFGSPRTPFQYQLPAAPPQVAAPTSTPAPQGPIPPGMGPSAAYPTQQKALPKPTPGQKAPLVTPPPADTSGPIPNAGPRPGAGMGQNTGTRTLTGATPGQKAPYVTPAPADTSGPTGQVPRPGSGMGQNTGTRTLPAPAQPQRNHPGDTYGPHGMGPAVTSERPPEWNGRQPQVADTHDMVKIQTKEHPEGIWVRRSDLKGPAAPLPKKP